MKRDHLLGLLLVLIGLAGLLMTAQIPVRTFTDDPGPRLFPTVGFVVLILSGLGIALVGRGGGEDGGEGGPPLNARAWRRLAAMALALIGYALAMWVFGFYPATVVMTMVFYAMIAGPERRSLIRGAVFSLIVTAAVWAVFGKALNAFLPQGMLG